MGFSFKSGFISNVSLAIIYVSAVGKNVISSSTTNCGLYEADLKDMDKALAEDASLYLMGRRHERNRAALKARGF